MTSRLMSYYSIEVGKLQPATKLWEVYERGKMKKVELFLDSGAYSAWSKKIEINIQEYIQFIKDHIDYLDHYSVLDAIGDPVQTLKNQKIMEDAGLKPIPCFHYGEPLNYLTNYLDNYDYVSLGGMVPIPNVSLIEWLDNLFSKFICDDKGMPKVKIHGFGMTSLDLMLRFPWYSVDSTSWVLTGRFGAVYVPKKKMGKYDYMQNSMTINVSNRSPKDKEEGQHFSTYSQMEQKEILEYFMAKGFEMGESEFRQEDPKTYKPKEGERWYGKELADAQREYVEMGMGYKPITAWKEDGIIELIKTAGLSNDYRLRDELNIIYFLDLQDNLPPWPWAFKIKKVEGFGFK